jgi:hypothetical protein
LNFLQDIITYVRRIIKTPNNAVITDALIIDYINRFWMMDVDARVQLFDLKTKYQFQTTPTVDKYNMPLYSVQTQQGAQQIGMYPVYQGFIPPVYINGIQVPFQTQKSQFYNIWPNIVQNLGVVGTGNGSNGPYTLQFPILSGTVPPNPPYDGILRGHIDMAGIISTAINQDPPIVSNTTFPNLLGMVPTTSIEPAVYITSIDENGASVVVSDSGFFLLGAVNNGMMMSPGPAPFGNTVLPGGYSATSNTVNYLTGQVTFSFPTGTVIPSGSNINAQCFYYQTGLPRAVLYYDNTLVLRTVPDIQYLVEIDAYLSPAAFLNSNAAIPFGYMAEYIARGAARKILSDTGDMEQFQFYEPLFREQETLVWKRSQRTWTQSRTESIYSQGFGQGAGFNNNYGGGVSL